MRRGWLLLVLLAACGRFGFETSPQGDGRLAGGDATGSGGPRWVAVLGNGSMYFPIAGASGAPTVAFGFLGSTQIPGRTLTGVASARSSAVVRFDAAGAVQAATVLDAQYTCDARGLAMRGSDVLVAAFSHGSAMPALGACSVSTGRQDPVVLAVDAAGNQSLLQHGMAVSQNVQAWNIGVLPDASYVFDGIYSASAMFGSTSLPTAGTDPNAYMVHLMDGQANPLWALSLTAGVQVTPGRIDVENTELCVEGAYAGAGLTELGTALPFAGVVDDFVARIDSSGTPKFVRGFGSTQADSDFGDGSVVAAGGGCTAAMKAPADVTIGATTLPSSAGGAVVVTFDSSGAFSGGFRTEQLAQLATVNGTVYAAYGVSQPATIGGTTFTPQGMDTIVVEIGATGPTRLVGAVTGAGDQTAITLAAIGPDALAVGVATTGELTFGGTTVQTVSGDFAVAVLGL